MDIKNLSTLQILPNLSEQEYTSLREDIKLRGVQVPVEYDESGNILDGHHRVKACQELGIKDWPRIVRVGLSEEEKIEHVLAVNLARRHLSAEQRKKIILDLRSRGWSLRRIARVLRVDDKTVQNQLSRSTAENSAVEHPSSIFSADGKLRPAVRSSEEELLSKIQKAKELKESGESVRSIAKKLGVSVGTAHAYLKYDIESRKPSILVSSSSEHEKLQKVLSQVSPDDLPQKVLYAKRAALIAREAIAEKRAETAPSEATLGEAKILLKDFRELDLEPESVDLVFTDPPYPKEFLPLWSDLSLFCNRVLKPGGLLIVYSGQAFLPEVIQRLSEHLQYVWCGSLFLEGRHNMVHAKYIRNRVKPILFYSKGDYSPKVWFEDWYYSEGRDKEYHEWQQSLGAALYYIKTLTSPGDLVVDPFLGSGTTAVASVKLGRKFVGCDIDPVAVQSCLDRLKEVEAGGSSETS